MIERDEDEKIALQLDVEQDRRFRQAKDKIAFFDDPHEKHILAKIKHHRAMSLTYDPDNPNKR